MSETVIETAGLSKTYGTKEVLHPTSLSVRKGEILAVIGPSGAGKSTLLRLLDGLEKPSSGEIRIFGEPFTRKTRRKIRARLGILFQKTVLFDRSVEDNIALGLSYRRIPRAERKLRAKETLEKLGMAEYAGRSARTLSGGEGQRVSFARILVTRPEILFLDEPTANLDPLASKDVESMILAENAENGTTIVINTHDQMQAQRLADRVSVILDGSVVQTGTPDEIWYHPVNASVARFVGFQNIFDASAADGTVSFGGLCVAAPASLHGDVSVMIRAEDIVLTKTQTNISGIIRSLSRRGAFVEISVETGVEFFIRIPFKEYDSSLSVGDTVFLTWNNDALVIGGNQ
ncbi:MAG: ABC transporter ATP-binding protein [Methanocorpusculum parvum]|nr:ABC transporter ATP-binding protein [Methanocorpusculum parvum]